MKSVNSIFIIFFLLLFLSVTGLNTTVAHAESIGEVSSRVENLPFSDAVRVGNLLFLSGSIGVIPGTLELAPGGIRGETRQTMENIKATLEKYGSSLGEVVKCTVFLAKISDWSEMNEIYIEFFPLKPPARSALGVNGLALGALTEIECIATVSD